MGLFSKLIGNKNAAMLCCFDIAKPILATSSQNALNLAKYKDLFKHEEREIIAIMITMKFVHLYMHIFDRLFIDAYGQQKLSKAQEILFQVIANEFRKMFPNFFEDNTNFCNKFFSSFTTLETLLLACEGIIPPHMALAKGGNSVVSVFSKAIGDSVLNSSDAAFIDDICLNASEGFTSLFMAQKMQNTLAKLASFV